MKDEELKEILSHHKEWLLSEGSEGKRANLSHANLRWTNLSHANLRWTDLSYANLRWTDLSYANLRWTDLSHANLTGAKRSYERQFKLKLRRFKDER